jgi:hypothetical protein
LKRECSILKFKITSRLDRVESPTNNGGRIFEATQNCTSMDVVKLFAKDPFIFGVIDFKATVWWNAVLSVYGTEMVRV